jgi:hypothetical protein
MSGLFIDMAGLLGALSRWRVLEQFAADRPLRNQRLAPVHSFKTHIEVDYTRPM